MSQYPTRFDRDDLLKCARGELFGPGNAQLPEPPMLMMDRITEISGDGGEHGKGHVVAEFDITPDLWFFDCHFPGNPVMPGVLIIEAMAQASGMLANLDASLQGETGELYYLVKVDKAKFSKTVVPGDQLVLEVIQTRILRRMGFYSCEALVDGQRVATCEILCAGK